MKVMDRISAIATPTDAKIAKLCSGSSGLVMSETKPTMVVMPARRTAMKTSLSPLKMASSYSSFVISPFTLLSSM